MGITEKMDKMLEAKFDALSARLDAVLNKGRGDKSNVIAVPNVGGVAVPNVGGETGNLVAKDYVVQLLQALKFSDKDIRERMPSVSNEQINKNLTSISGPMISIYGLYELKNEINEEGRLEYALPDPNLNDAQGQPCWSSDRCLFVEEEYKKLLALLKKFKSVLADLEYK